MLKPLIAQLMAAEMLPEVKAMMLCTMLPKITLARPEVKAMRCGEGCHI
jgi:hypothetical protein